MPLKTPESQNLYAQSDRKSPENPDIAIGIHLGNLSDCVAAINSQIGTY